MTVANDNAYPAERSTGNSKTLVSASQLTKRMEEFHINVNTTRVASPANFRQCSGQEDMSCSAGNPGGIIESALAHVTYFGIGM